MTTATPRHGRDGEAERHAGRWLAIRTGQVIAAACSVVVFVAFGIGWYNYRDLTHHAHSVAVTGLGQSTPTPGAPTSTVPHVTGQAENILIVGVDSRAGLTDAQKRLYKVGQGDESTSTDTIIVVHVPADGSRATLLSIPRDSYVDIPGYQTGKINAAYADGYYRSGANTPKAQQGAAASTLVATVKQLTGLAIDHYVQVGFSGFVDIVNAIGKIPVDLCESVDDTYAHNRAIGGSGGSGFKLSAGHHDLNPQQALEFVRQRHNIPGKVTDDLGRENRQRYFLRQAFTKIASADVLLNPFKLHRLVNAVDNAFTFDKTDGFGIQQFAEQLSDLTAGNIAGKSIPTTGNQLIDGQSVLTVDPTAVQRFAKRLFSAHSHRARRASATPSPSAPTSPTATASGAPKASCID